MSKHLHRDLDRLKRDILTMGAMVEEAINKSIRALTSREVGLAEEVLEGDGEIDRKEVDIEEDCLKILALHQPVAVDLRFIVTVMKVNNDLERMGDLATNIAERAVYLASHPPMAVPLDFGLMAERVRSMVRDSLDALVRQDQELARKVLQADDEVDAINRSMFTLLQRAIKEDVSTVKRAIHTLSASRYLERIADHATNIAEDVVFMVDGEIIRHHFENFREQEE
ncbi:MAG: phosphate signaling complex protein PhoU [Acidobacteriota bacterium]